MHKRADGEPDEPESRVILLGFQAGICRRLLLLHIEPQLAACLPPCGPQNDEASRQLKSANCMGAASSVTRCWSLFQIIGSELKSTRVAYDE